MLPNRLAEFAYQDGSDSTTLTLGLVYTIDEDEGWTFTVTRDAGDIKLSADFGISGNGEDLQVRHRSSYFRVWLTNYVEGTFSTCGLCGIYDGDRSNDLHIYDNIYGDYDYLSLSWRNSHTFADTWCNPTIAALSTVGDYNCNVTTDDINEPSDDCLELQKHIRPNI